MLSVVLAAYLATALPPQADEPTPRPTDEQLLAAVVAEVPNGRVLSSDFGPTPRGGGWKGCGLIEVNGVVEPFSVLTHWEDAEPERPSMISSMRVRGADGRMHDWAPPPTPAKPAGWTITEAVPTHQDRVGDGPDRFDRNLDTLARRNALMFCPGLSAPEGQTWAMEPEPHPDPERQRRSERLAKQLTDMIFSAGERAAD